MSDNLSLTWYGNKVYYDNPERSEIDIRDVAHALAVQPRWAGHTNWHSMTAPYSVAQHSIWCARTVDMLGGTREAQLCALLHDAAEAYLGDLNTYAKAMCPDYKALERRLLRVIFREYQLPEAWAAELPDIVKKADLLALRSEVRLCHKNMAQYIEPFGSVMLDVLADLSPKEVEAVFLTAFEGLL